MTTTEHDILVDIHERVQIMPSLKDLIATKKSLIRGLMSKLNGEEAVCEPSNRIRQNQVKNVWRLLLESNMKNTSLSLHMACVQAWQNLKGGYPSPKALYQYCHEHENEFNLPR